MNIRKSKNSNFIHRLLSLVFFLTVLFFGVAISVDAVNLDNTVYIVGDQIIAPDGTGPVVLYNLDPSANNNSPYFETWGFDPGSNINYFGIVSGNYSMIELTTSGICQGQGLSYDDCKLAPEYVGEFLFSVQDPLEVGQESARVEESNSQFLFNYQPIVSIFSPKSGSVFSRKGIIRYRASDQNDNGYDIEKTMGGLVDKPVSLFYSDKIPTWNFSIVDPIYKNSIASQLTSEASFDWDIEGLVPGVLYRIVVDAVDRGGQIGESISDFFTVDFTPPTFSVLVNPPAVRKGSVTITIESSEKLGAPPTVSVTQDGGDAVSVQMIGEETHFVGTYTIRSNHDGTAKISVSGTDIAGNTSQTIVSGGTFSVGVNPPPKPSITSPSSDTVVSSDSILVEGVTRADTVVMLKVNGVNVSTAQPDSKGKFQFLNVSLEKESNQGINIIDVVARDVFGSISESSNVTVKRNISPTVSIVKPVSNQIINDRIAISVQGIDANNDLLTYTYQIKPSTISRDTDWETIGENIPTSGFDWNATEVDDGEYVLRAVATDGIQSATSTPVRITVRNTLPFFRFENGRKTVTKDRELEINAVAMTSKNIPNRPSVVAIDYSIGNENNWTPIQLSNSGSSVERKFSITMPTQKEGKIPLFLRAKDSRGMYGKAVHLIVVDRTPPKAPIVITPKEGATLSVESDENAKALGLQLKITGTAESGSKVTFIQASSSMSSQVSQSGVFRFPIITLTSKGLHTLSFFTTDEAGNTSAIKQISVTYNNPPNITFVNPKPFGGISGSARISWDITDIDNDKITNVAVRYRRGNDPFTLLVSNKEAFYDYQWDTSKLSDGNDYELRIDASDAFSHSVATESFSVDTGIPTLDTVSLSINTQQDRYAFIASGKASDSVSGVEFIEYSIYSKENATSTPWYKSLITKGYLQRNASFTIKHPINLSQGSYTLFVRAVDAAGNISKDISIPISIDVAPPRIGSFFFRTHNIDLTPDETGALSVLAQDPLEFFISLEHDTASANLFIGDATYELHKDNVTGLWTSSLSLVSTTTEQLSISAEDIKHNKLARKNIGQVQGLMKGKVYSINKEDVVVPVTSGDIRVLTLNEKNRRYVPAINDQGESIVAPLNENGEYSLVLPRGTYKLVFEKKGWKKVEQKLDLPRGGYVTVSFEMRAVSGFYSKIQSMFTWFQN